MSYSTSTYSAAQVALEKRRKRAESEQEMHREEAFIKIPQLRSIQAEIAQYGTQVIQAFAHGANAEQFVQTLAAKSLAAQQQRKDLLIANGFAPDYLEAHYVCLKCKDTGITDDGICDCLRELLIDKAKEKIAAVAPLSESTFESFSLSFYPDTADAAGYSPKKRMGEILNFCNSYADDFSCSSPSLFMHGATGLGKTHLALAIASKAIERGHGVVYASAPNLFTALERERFGKGELPALQGLNEDEIENADLLIIDDLGAEFSTQFTVSCAYNIINTRMLAQKPTIITTNLTMPEFESKYTQRITSRITGNYISLMFLGHDIRQLKRYGGSNG
ncbi:MAG TPA: ATP-binding protein [Ruminococcaceae bacterium]|nr:ATP-binding protein [Oscillospiraceae bacterium]